MNQSATLAGFISAHAVWSVADGETLIPIYAFTTASGERQMERLMHERLEDGVEAGKRKLDEIAPDVYAKVLVFDGRIPWQGEKLDALIIEWRSYGAESGKAVMALLYTPPLKGGLLKRARRFAVHKPKLLEVSDNWRERSDTLVQSYFDGVGQHQQGSAVWNDHLDESK